MSTTAVGTEPMTKETAELILLHPGNWNRMKRFRHYLSFESVIIELAFRMGDKEDREDLARALAKDITTGHHLNGDQTPSSFGTMSSALSIQAVYSHLRSSPTIPDDSLPTVEIIKAALFLFHQHIKDECSRRSC